MEKIGILVHGRHLGAVEWEKLVWGEPPHKLGALPMMILVALNAGLENIAGIVFGTGASEKDGLKESEFTKLFLLDRITQLRRFGVFLDHSGLRSEDNVVTLINLCRNIICDVDSKNTDQEVANAAKIFSGLHVKEVRQVTCGSHAPRCILTQLKVRAAGGIPSEQVWSCIGDHMSFAGSRVGDAVIFEPPHRGDDPMLTAPIQAHKVFSRFFGIPGFDNKVAALYDVREIIQKYTE